jgi:hypothetical protein
MPSKNHTAEENIHKLREAEFLPARGKKVPEAMRTHRP